MNKKEKAMLLFIISIGIVILPSVIGYTTYSGTGSINDSIINIKAKQINYATLNSINDNFTVETYDVFYYVKVSAEPTYTFTQREFVKVTLDMNKMNTFNDSIETAIAQRAKDLWNYTLPHNKISYHAYTKGKD